MPPSRARSSPPARTTFCAGADLTMLERISRQFADMVKAQGEEAAVTRLFEESRKLSQLYRRIETSRQAVGRGDQRHRARRRLRALRSPATTASPPTTPRRASACRRSRSACFPAPAARSASRA